MLFLVVWSGGAEWLQMYDVLQLPLGGLIEGYVLRSIVGFVSWLLWSGYGSMVSLAGSVLW